MVNLKKIFLLECILASISILISCAPAERNNVLEDTGLQSTEIMEESEPEIEENGAAETDSYYLYYEGTDTGLEIFFDDCTCEYDKNGIKVFSCYVDDEAVDVQGYAVYIQTPDDTMAIFPVEDYLVDKNNGSLYMIWGINEFERIQGVNFTDGIVSYKAQSIYDMEDMIGEAYGLDLQTIGENFGNIQVDFTELSEDNGHILLCGTASAVYYADGESYSVVWKVDTDSWLGSAEAYLENLNIHPLYAAFLRGEISVANPYASEEDAIPEFSFFFEQNEEYGNTFENATKSFSLVDVNGDGGEELIFAIDDGHDHIQFIFGILNDKLICYDVFETHTHYVGFDVYDNGNAWWGQNYDGGESVYYTYDGDGNPIELIHFVREYDSDSGLRYDYYYLDGDEEAKVYFSSDEEYEELDSAYAGNILQWYQCGSFADIPEW